MTRADCVALDAEDRLAVMRSQFDLEAIDAQGVIYLDGNSLGALPLGVAERVNRVITAEWRSEERRVGKECRL